MLSEILNSKKEKKYQYNVSLNKNYKSLKIWNLFITYHSNPNLKSWNLKLIDY